jgi:hypothetical protein
MKWVTSLLDDCLQHHEDCSSTEQAQLPRRILVLDDSSEGNITIRLEENELKLSRYATLSHCWGHQQRCTTTCENFEERKIGIPWNEIPKTFQDSIIYCLKLGIRYLWVDALCIIQNDTHDWEVESSKMAAIYQNSFITLAATAARSDSDGCFMDTPNIRAEYELSALEESEPILVREKLHHWEPAQTEASMQRDPLLTRGWVFQERMLSPRTVHFCNRELVWECASLIKCECGGVDPRTGMKSHFSPAHHNYVDLHDQAAQMMYPELFQRRHSPSTRPDSDSDDPDSDDPDSDNPDSRNKDFLPGHLVPREAQALLKKWQLHINASEKWHWIVEEYSALQLTKSSDRLPALSGLAVRSVEFLGSYAAGLWRDTIACDILWRVDQLQLHSGRPVERGPSWSWISVNSRVKYWRMDEIRGYVTRQTRNTMATASVLTRYSPRAVGSDKLRNFTCAVEVKVRGENPFGEVQSGKLFLNGYLRSAILSYMDDWVKDPDSEQHARKEHNPLTYRLIIDQLFLPFYADYILSGEGGDNVPDNAMVFLLQVFPNICLVLKNTGQAHSFKRIGIFKTTNDFERNYGTDIMSKSVKRLVVIN